MSDEDLLERALPKWPQMIVTGARLPERLALEVIRRTDVWFLSGQGCNDHDGDRRLARRFRMPHFHDFAEDLPKGFDWTTHWNHCNRWKKAWGAIETRYVRNNWIGSTFQPHGWCHPDGHLYFIGNVGKWPSIEDIRTDWQTLIAAFSFLGLTVTLMSGENCEASTRPVVAMRVANGQVRLMEPNAGDHGPPRREIEATVSLLALHPAQRERYPFREDVMRAWEEKALEVDAGIQRGTINAETAASDGEAAGIDETATQQAATQQAATQQAATQQAATQQAATQQAATQQAATQQAATQQAATQQARPAKSR